MSCVANDTAVVMCSQSVNHLFLARPQVSSSLLTRQEHILTVDTKRKQERPFIQTLHQTSAILRI